MKVKEILPFDPFNDVPLEPNLLSLFVDRDKEIERIKRLVESAAAGFRQNIAILGIDGMGKTSILNYIYGMTQMSENLLTIRMEITQDTTVQDLLNAILRGMLDSVKIGFGWAILSFLGRSVSIKEIKEVVNGFRISKSNEISMTLFGFINASKRTEKAYKGPEDFSHIFNTLVNMANYLPKKIKAVILLFDEGEYVAKERSANLLQSMRLLFQTNPFMVAIAGSSLLFEKFASIEPSFGNLFPEQNRILLRALEFNDVKQLIIKRIDQVKTIDKGTIEPFTDDAIRIILEYSKGNPRYVIRIASTSVLKAINETKITAEHAKEGALEVNFRMGQERFARLGEEEAKLVILIAKLKAPSVSELAKEIEVDEATISRRLNHLEDAGFVKTTKEGRKRVAFLEEPLRTFVLSNYQ